MELLLGSCPCTFVLVVNYDPVCGADGQEYPNACLAACYGIPIQCKGKCPCKGNDLIFRKSFITLLYRVFNIVQLGPGLKSEAKGLDQSRTLNSL